MSSILLVDDDRTILDVVGEMLRLEGHQVTVATNGEEALSELNEGGHDLMITDLIMPVREGVDTISHIREAPSDLPILAISGGGDKGPEVGLESALGVGADATLAKPFAFNDLISAVNSLLT